jgi:hypothetical protein
MAARIACFFAALALGHAMISSMVRAQPRHRRVSGSSVQVLVQGLAG